MYSNKILYLHVITINVTVVYMARDLMFLMWATSITRAIRRGVTGTFSGPGKRQRAKRVPFWPKKSRFSGPPPPFHWHE